MADPKLEAILKKQEPAIRRAFLLAIREITDRVVIRRLIAALKDGNIEAAIAALDIETAAYRVFAQEIGNTYSQAGAVITSGVVWRFANMTRATVRWDMANPRAEAWVKSVSSDKVTLVVDAQKEALRTAIGGMYSRGMGPNNMVTEIVGSIGPNGKRTGGIVGLNGPQLQWVENMRGYLETDPTRALTMTRRDKRFDKTINKSIRDGKPLSRVQIAKMLQSYNNRLLDLRARTIARTETAMAVEAARYEAFKQGLDKTGIPETAVYREWLHGWISPSGKERPTHIALHKTRAYGLSVPFVTYDGVSMLHALDGSLGAGAHDLANCRCSTFIGIDYSRIAR